MDLRRGFLPLVLALLPCAIPVPAVAAEGPRDILTLFDDFVSSGAAASHCASPTDEIAVRFLSNFQWVSTYAIQEMSRRSPDATTEEVAAELAARSLAVKTQIHSLVKSEGCESEAVRELVRHFLIQSAWTPASA